MEDEEKIKYLVEYTVTATNYFYQAINYFYEHHSLSRAEVMVNELEQLAQSLAYLPHRGAEEKWLEGRPQKYRFLLYQRTKRSGIKVIYFVDDPSKIVYVTDFFPTEKDSEEISLRS
ncbi:MAG: hypothetical protein AAF551_09455 [Bacteroidota bacterium]